MVHGDLKPANVLLKGSRDDIRGFEVKVSDFGLARVVHSSNRSTGVRCGTMQVRTDLV